MQRFILITSALVLNLSFAASAFADRLSPSTSPTNPSPGLPCTGRIEPL